MRINRRSVLVAAPATMLAAACTTTFKPATVNAATGRYSTTTVVPASAITIREDYPVDEAKRFVFVRSNLAGMERYDSYFETSLRNLNFFEEVLRKDQFERMLVHDQHAADVPSVDGFAGLARAAQIYGRFLVIDFKIQPGAGYHVDMTMSVYDAATANEVLHVDYGITNWAGLDSTLFQPVFNVLVDWIHENSSTFQPATTATPPAQPATTP
ncbi:MAG: hypothetical protein HY054_10245 [Proteobacteria bacterium]|nr:hypothetical protein [Pseudomonadota bacterium]